MSGSTTTSRREIVYPEAVEVPSFGSDGSEKGSKTFTPGGVTNYPNVPLLKEAVRHYQGRLRRGTANTKERGEVSGAAGRKPWRQKGTGRARQGSRKSPIWRGGGVVFGPKPRDYDYGLPKKQRRLATRHALLSKLLDGESRVIESLCAEVSARALERTLRGIGVQESCLIGVASNADRDQITNVVRSADNIHGVQVLTVQDFNTLALLKHRSLLLTEDALTEVQDRENAIRSEQGGQSS